jgi:hypothetical protein
MGSKGDLLRTLATSSGVKPATPGVRSSVPSWRMGCPLITYFFQSVTGLTGPRPLSSPRLDVPFGAEVWRMFAEDEGLQACILPPAPIRRGIESSEDQHDTGCNATSC